MVLGPFKPNSTEDCYEMYSDWYIYIHGQHKTSATEKICTICELLIF